ncbi:MAG: ABC transporter substrate binding protein [Thermodesulfobacteriota bacterium]
MLFVNSYHPGYAWSDQVQRGAETVLRAGNADVRVVYMDSKRKPGDASLRAAAERVLAEIVAFRPEVVIAADDNAQRFLVVPHLKDGPIPVVFCGVNWDASEFGYPTRYVTGMVEMEAVNTLVGHLRKFARGDRIGFLADESETERKIFDNYNRRFFGGRLIPYFAVKFAEFKAHFLRAQSETDMLILAGNAAISDWDDAEARDFVARHGRVPTGATMDYMAPYAMVTMAKVPEEQGQWAASRALDILAGVPPLAIPVSWNNQARLIVNLDLAQASGFSVPLSLLRAASEVIGGGRSELARSLQAGS